MQLLGYLPQDALRHYLHASDLFVLSSREVSDRRTGLGDAETMGRVHGWLVPEACPVSLAQAIHRLANSPDLTKRLASQGRLRARQEFDWPVRFAAHEAEIQDLLRG